MRGTAAWRIALWTTLAFSVGTFVAFFIVYLMVAQEVRARSDAWLTGEAQVLAQVAHNTPRDTELGVEVRSLTTGHALGRPWMTLLVDAFSRRILGLYLTFDPPSYRSHDGLTRLRQAPRTVSTDGPCGRRGRVPKYLF